MSLSLSVMKRLIMDSLIIIIKFTDFKTMDIDKMKTLLLQIFLWMCFISIAPYFGLPALAFCLFFLSFIAYTNKV